MLAIEIGVVHSSIFLSEIVQQGPNVLVQVTVANLADETKAQKVVTELTRVEGEGYFDLATDPEDPTQIINVMTANSGAPKIVKPSASGGNTEINEGVPVGTVVVIVLFCLGGAAAAVGFLYKRAQERMRAQVRNILAEYMPLEDTGGGGMTSGVGFAQRGGVSVAVQPNESETAAMI